MKQYTEDQAKEALRKVIWRFEKATRQRLLAEVAGTECWNLEEAEDFAKAFCKAVVVADAEGWPFCLDRLADAKAVLGVD